MRILALALIAVLLAAAAATAATKIYRVVDRDGNVSFTDQPPQDDKNVTEVELSSGNTFDAGPVDPEPWIVDEVANDEADTVAPYTSAVIVAPANDEALRENAGNVSVRASVTPALRPGDQLRLLLDGTPHSTVSGVEFMLTNVDRGTHTLSVDVIDPSGAVLLQGATSTFHLQRYSAARAPAPGPNKGG